MDNHAHYVICYPLCGALSSFNNYLAFYNGLDSLNN